MPIFSSAAKDRLRNSKPSTNGFSLYAVFAFLFSIEMREALDAKTGGDKSDGAWTWGL